MTRTAQVVLFLILLILRYEVSADQWQSIGPFICTVRQFVPDRNHPALWFALAWTGAAYRSTDMGKSWNQLSISASQIVVHPRTSEVFAVSSKGLLKSTDHGRTFQVVGSAGAILSVSPENSGVLI